MQVYRFSPRFSYCARRDLAPIERSRVTMVVGEITYARQEYHLATIFGWVFSNRVTANPYLTTKVVERIS